MLGSNSTKYVKVDLDEDSNDITHILRTETANKKTRSFTTACSPWLLHLVVIIAYSIILFANIPEAHKCSPCFSEDLLGAPILWEDRTFYTNAYVDDTDPYSRKNLDVDSTWAGLIENTITVITDEEKQNLPGGRDTARAYGGQDGYAIMIEMFHQLHCLNHLRTAYFSGNNSDPENHSDHCFSYLLQTLLCHADVGVMTVKWHEEWNVFKPEFNVTKQCRNYDLIKDWAHSRKARFFPETQPTDNLTRKGG